MIKLNLTILDLIKMDLIDRDENESIRFQWNALELEIIGLERIGLKRYVLNWKGKD